MPASTVFQRFRGILTLLILLLMSGQAMAYERVQVSAAKHHIRQLSEGFSRLLVREINQSGLLQAEYSQADEIGSAMDFSNEVLVPYTNEPAQPRFSLEVSISSFEITTRDNPMDLGRDFNDLSRMIGGSDELASCNLHIRLVDTLEDRLVLEGNYEGRESRRGVRLGRLSTHWLKSTDYCSAEFHESNIGLASYKAIGAFLYDLYHAMPFEGKVLAVQGDTAVVSLGELQLIEIGDELHVLRLAGIQNLSGKGVWDEPVRMATLRVLELRRDRCLCLVLDGSLQLREGDSVRPDLIRWTLPDEADHVSGRDLLY